MNSVTLEAPDSAHHGTISQVLAAVTRGLTDISSQHEHHTLSDPSTHLGYLDAFARLEPEEIARMLGGLKITAKTSAPARELLLHARQSAA